MSTERKHYPMSGEDALQILFIYLKLTNQIDWSWWSVMAPFWVTLILKVIIACLDDKEVKP